MRKWDKTKDTTLIDSIKEASTLTGGINQAADYLNKPEKSCENRWYKIKRDYERFGDIIIC